MPHSDEAQIVDADRPQLTLADWLTRVDAAIVADHQRPTKQRRLVAEMLYEQCLNRHRHLNVDELHREVRDADNTVGYATVYRTVKLLERVGLLTASRFSDGTARYEVALADEEHHDHLICTKCGQIVEFENHDIERLQHEIAASLGFTLDSHRMDLYGICGPCQLLPAKRR